MPAKRTRRRARRAANVNAELTFTAEDEAALQRIRSHVAAVGEVIARLSSGQRPTRDDVRAVRHALIVVERQRDPDKLSTAVLNAVMELSRRVTRATILIGDALSIDADKLRDCSATSSAWMLAEVRAGVRTSPDTSGRVQSHPVASSLIQASPGESKIEPPSPDKETLALVMLQQHPTWTDAQVAGVVGVHRGTLHRWPKYREARALLKQAGKSLIARGSKDRRTGRMDAVDVDDDD